MVSLVEVQEEQRGVSAPRMSYSFRTAVRTSILVARGAGRIHAASATATITSTAATMFTTSVAVSPNNKSEMKLAVSRTATMAAMMPAARPVQKTFIVSRNVS